MTDTEPTLILILFAVTFTCISLAYTFLKPWRPDTDPLLTGLAWAGSTASAIVLWLAVFT